MCEFTLVNALLLFGIIALLVLVACLFFLLYESVKDLIDGAIGPSNHRPMATRDEMKYRPLKKFSMGEKDGK